MKSGNLNFLEPSGPLQACNGTALPLPLPSVQHGVGIRTEETGFKRIISCSMKQLYATGVSLFEM
jgi:hypothetical protein